MEYVIIGVSALILGFIFVPLARQLAFKTGIVDKPSTRLKKHKKPVPYLGGLAIYFAFIIPVVAAKLIMFGTIKGVIGIVLGATVIMIMGLVDDVKNLSPYIKLAVQFLVALLIIKVNMNIKFMDNNILNMILTVLWVIGITNAMNIIDIMDGLAGGVAAVAALAFFCVAFMAGRVNDMIPAMALFGALLAFLFFNRAPAKIYMGDAGSLFLGFMMAALALNESYSVNNYIAVLSPLLILAVPLLDTLLVAEYRMRRGAPLFAADRNHIAHRLMRIGLSSREAVVLLYVLSALLGLLALLLPTLQSYQALLVMTHAVGVTMIVAFFIRKGERKR